MAITVIPARRSRIKVHLVKREIPTPVIEKTVCGRVLKEVARWTVDCKEVTCAPCREGAAHA